MKFKIEKDIFSKNLNKVVRVVSPRAVVPILHGVYLSISVDEGITLIGSNGDITIKSVIPVEIDEKIVIEEIEAGSIVVPAKLLNDIVKKLPNKPVSFEVDSKYHVQIKSGKSKFKLNGQDAEEYPRLPEKNENSFEVESSTLKEVIRKSVFAVSSVENRPILTGVNVKQEDNDLLFVATDSHRLSRNIIENTNASLSESITIPGITLRELNKILSDTEDLVKVKFSNSNIMFDIGNTLFYSRLLEGNFPDTRRLIPDDGRTKINVSRTELLNSLERALVLTDNAVVKFDANGGIMAEVSSNTPEVGNVNEDIVMANFEGEEVIISFSAKYAIDALDAIDSDEVVITFNGAMRPFTITAEKDESVIQLVLPVRTY